MSYQSVVLADSPLFLWPLNETSGTTAVDATGGGQSGTYAGTYTLASQQGPDTASSESCVQLDGTSGCVTSSYNPAMTNVSAECWVNLSGVSNPNATFLANDNTGSGGSFAGFRIRNLAGVLTANLGGNLSDYVTASGSAAVPTSGWHHLAATWDGTYLVLYLDGVQTGTSLPSAGIGSYVVGTNNIAAGFNPAYSGDYLNGLIAYAAVYNTTLTPTQIASHFITAAEGGALSPFGENVDPPPRMPGFTPGFPGLPMGEAFQPWPLSTSVERVTPTAPPPLSGYNAVVAADAPAAWWRLDETVGSTIAADSSGGGNPATAVQFVTFGAANSPAGISQTAAQGSADPNTGKLDTAWAPSGWAAWTVEAWVNANNTTVTNKFFLTYGKPWLTPFTGFALLTETSGKLNFRAGQGTQDDDLISTVAVTATGWYHVVGVADGVHMTIYVNGVQSGQITHSNALAAAAGGVSLFYQRIDNSAGWPGLACQVAVYSYALSVPRIQAHYNAGIYVNDLPGIAVQPAPGWFPGAPGMPLGTPFRPWPLPCDPGAAPAGAVTQTGAAAVAGAGAATAAAAQAAIASAPAAAAVTAVATVISLAAAAGTGSAAAIATQAAPGTAAGAGTVTGVITQAATASAAGAGAVTAVATQIAAAAAAGAGAVSDVVTQIATAAGAGAGSVTAVGSVSGAATAAIAAAGSVTAVVTQIAPAAGAGAGAVTAAAVQVAGAAAAGAGLAGPVPVTQAVIAAAAGAGSVSDAVTQIATATAAGAGSVTAAGSSSGAASAAAAGAGSVSAVATQIAPAAAAGTGAVTDVATQIAKASAAGAGAASASGAITGTASAAGAGAATAVVTQAAAATAAGAGTLAALAAQGAIAAITGAGSVTAVSGTTAAFTVGALTASGAPASVLTAAGASNALTGSTAPGSTLTATAQTTGGPS